MSFKIYLAGPIAGLNFDESESWRNHVKDIISPDIHCYSPLRAKSFLRKYGELGLGGIAYESDSSLSSSRGIMYRDHYDCQSADLIFCNLLGAKAVSIGTVMEIAWAFSYRKPLVLCIEPGNLHDHPMIREAVNFSCDNIDEGIRLVERVLLP